MPTSSFSITFVEVESESSSQLHPACCATSTSSRLLQTTLDDHHPWDILDNTALVIVNQTYAALLEILGPAAPLSSDDGHVEVSRPIDPADPDSPLLFVNASATHCCICLAHGGVGAEYRRYTSPKQKTQPQYRLARASVSVSAGTLHVALHADGPAHGWTCADDVRPHVSGKGLLAVLDTVRARLDAAIRVEARLVEVARASGCGASAKVNEIIDVRMALEKMRGELDADAIVCRRRQKRRREVQEICSGPDVDMVDDEAEVLARRLGQLHVCQDEKRCRPAAEMDDADVLTKRLRALQV